MSVHEWVSQRLVLLIMWIVSSISLVYLVYLVMETIKRYRRRRENNDGEVECFGSFGLCQRTLDSIPEFVYKAPGGEEEDEDEDEAKLCSVCLGEFVENEVLKELPSCKHRFHKGCIDMWLFSHRTCPLCRALVKRRSTPEVVVATVPTITVVVVSDDDAAEAAAAAPQGGV